jgi:hypothetical protein
MRSLFDAQTRLSHQFDTLCSEILLCIPRIESDGDGVFVSKVSDKMYTYLSDSLRVKVNYMQPCNLSLNSRINQSRRCSRWISPVSQRFKIVGSASVKTSARQFSDQLRNPFHFSRFDAHQQYLVRMASIQSSREDEKK